MKYAFAVMGAAAVVAVLCIFLLESGTPNTPQPVAPQPMQPSGNRNFNL